MDALVTGISAAGGLILGDELEVVVARLGARQTLERPWWRCAHCAAPWRRSRLVPLVHAATAGACPECNEPVALRWRPLVMALVSAAVLGGLAARFGDDVVLAPYAVLALALVAISAVDFEHKIIPNRIVYPTLAVIVPLFVIASAVDHRWGSLGRAAIAGAAAFIAFLAVHLAVPHGMGFGDVRLAGLVGFATGWLGLGHAFVGLLAAFMLGALVGVAAMALTGAGRKTRIPFGPFLAAGALLAILWGSPVAHALFHRPA
jgi:leader peptidase (prepilin peptidase) / N-methyltransferase